MAHNIHIGQNFEDFRAFESAIERYQNVESVQLFKRDSRTYLTNFDMENFSGKLQYSNN